MLCVASASLSFSSFFLLLPVREPMMLPLLLRFFSSLAPVLAVVLSVLASASLSAKETVSAALVSIQARSGGTHAFSRTEFTSTTFN